MIGARKYAYALTTGGLRSPISVLGSDLVEWWSADHLSDMTVVSNAVAAWSGRRAGYTLLQASSSYRPIYNPTSFGGAPGLTFDGIDDYMSIASIPADVPIGADPCEMWAVVHQSALASDSATRRIMAYGGAGTNNTARYVVKSGGSGDLVINVGTGSAVQSAGASLGLFVSRHVVRAQFGSAVSKASLDNGPDGSVVAVPATAPGLFCVGLGTNLAGPWKGQIRDILITKPLSDAKKAKLMSWALPRRRL